MSELSPETEDLLARGREGSPLSTSRRDNLKGAVLAKIAIGAGAAGTGLTASSTSAAAWTMTTKTIGVAVLAAVIGTGTVGVVKYERHAQPPVVSTSVNSETPNSSPVARPTPEIAPVVTTNSQTTQPIAQNAIAPIAPATTSAPNPTFASDRPNTPNSQVIVASSNTAANAGTNVGASDGTPNVPPPHPSSLEEETSLLRSAHDALAAGDPARALRLLDEHASRFPTSALEPERSAERVFAFCAEQQNDAAHAAAGNFLSAHPTGPLSARVRSSCGGR
ncbi:MAG: hypothetical protein ABI183_14670 [Polyangiaceae bacterium]